MGKNDQNSHEKPPKAIKPVVTFFALRQKMFTSAEYQAGVNKICIAVKNITALIIIK